VTFAFEPEVAAVGLMQAERVAAVTISRLKRESIVRRIVEYRARHSRVNLLVTQASR
jgi:hypothetical protein